MFEQWFQIQHRLGRAHLCRSMLEQLHLGKIKRKRDDL